MKKPAAPPVVYRWITLAEALELGLEDLIHLQAAETLKDGIPLVIDWAQYRRLERMGIHRSIAAMQGGRLLGYNAFFIQPTLHHATTIIAINDLIYLDPDARRGMTGVLLITRAEKMLAELGVRKVVYASKPYLNLNPARTNATVASLLGKLGYTDAETIHEKLL